MDFLMVLLIKVGILAVAVGLALFCDRCMGSPLVRLVNELLERG